MRRSTASFSVLGCEQVTSESFCRELTAWGGAGRGTVEDITGRDWRPYLQSADHPECVLTCMHVTLHTRITTIKSKITHCCMLQVSIGFSNVLHCTCCSSAQISGQRRPQLGH